MLKKEHIIDTLIKDSTPSNEEELQHTKNEFLTTYLNDEELLNYTKIAIEKLSISKPPQPKDRLGFYENVLYLDGEKFNINNIYEASKFMGQFYNYAEVY